MATVKVRWSVAELANVMTQYDVERVFRSTTGEAGIYTEVTTVLTRVPLVADQPNYYFDDTAGANTYWYKTQHYNSVSFAESSFSDPMSGESSQDPALSIITIDELKNFFLFGLDLTNDEGTEYPDSLYEHFIASAVSWLEERLDIPILETTVTEEKHDFYKHDYDKYMWAKVEKFPIISVSEVKMVLPGDNIVQTFDESWIHFTPATGQVQIVPGTGGAGTMVFGMHGSWLPFIYGGNKFIPDVFQISYVAGLSPVPPIIKDLVGKVASFGPLNIAGDLLGGAGIASQSISIDGLNTNFNTTSSSTSAGYGARLIQYQKEIKEVVPTLRRSYKGIPLSVV